MGGREEGGVSKVGTDRNSVGRPKGSPKTGGRARGTPNRLSAANKECVDAAFKALGGVTALTAWAKDNPEVFYTRIWARLLPKPVEVSGGEGASVRVLIEYVDGDE